MKHLLWFLYVIAIPSESRSLSPLKNQSFLVLQAVQDEDPEAYEKVTKNLTEKEFTKIILKEEIEGRNNLLHLMAGVRTHQGYFAIQILKSLKQLAFEEADKLFFKRNIKRLSPLEIAENIKNGAAISMLSKIREELRNKRPLTLKRNWLKVEVLAFRGIGLLFLLNGTALYMTGWELPGSLIGGLTSFAVSGMACYASFKKIKEIKKINPKILWNE